MQSTATLAVTIDPNWGIAVPFGLLAIIHSALGEARILRPLFSGTWHTGGLPRRVSQAILRFAWHLTSVAWLATAGIFAGLDIVAATTISAAVSAAMIATASRAHLAWPLFLIASLAGARHLDWLNDTALAATGWIAVAVLGTIALLHVSWAAGSDRLAGSVVPTTSDGGEATFSPPVVATLVVAGALLVVALAAAAVLLGTGPAITRWIAAGAAGVLALRAVGDGRYVGFTKTIRGTSFAIADDAIFTPLVVCLSLALVGTLL